jgi:hypothetical protein
MLAQTSGSANDYCGGDNAFHSLAGAPGITLMRLRSVNAAGNPNFEIDQFNTNTALIAPANNVRVADRWFIQRSAITGSVNTQVVNNAFGSSLVVPGTSYAISRSQLNLNVSTTQATLAAADYFSIRQLVEGPMMRELSMDVHSISVLAWTSVSGGLKFSVALRDNPATKSLVKLCTIPQNTWTLVTLPNIPVWPAGNWSVAPGVVGYELCVCLAAGGNLIAAAADTWQTASVIGAPGMDNYLSKASGQFALAFIQHEPGASCTTPQDLGFDSNLSQCQRYLDKSYDYAAKPGTASTSNGAINMYNFTGGNANVCLQPIRYTKRMAKVPTITAYSNVSGATGTIRDATAGADRTVTAANVAGDGGFCGFNISGGSAPPINYQWQWVADTMW